MSARKQSPSSKPEAMTYEQAIAELEALIEQIESGELGLEEALAARKRGSLLVQRCRGILEQAEQELEKIEVDDSDAGADDASAS
jgi:exodeoxyribonuclease VII small subunit